MSDWIPDLIERMGYLGIALLMFIENVFPPIPSEVIMPLAGVAAAQGKLNIWGVLVAGAVGSLAGAFFWYAVARALGLARFERFALRYGRLLTLDHDEIERGKRLFERWGGALVGFGRVVPTVRSLISIPAGLVHMNLLKFLAYSAIGTVAWTTGLTLAGYLLGRNFSRIDEVLGPLSTGVIVLAFGIYLFRLVTFSRKHPRSG